MVMRLYSDNSQYSHRIRLLLGVKAMSFELIPIDHRRQSQELLDVNPYNLLPTLVSREITLYDHMTMMEYMEERFPYPKLLPVMPLARAELRQLIFRIQKDLCDPADIIVNGPPRRRDKARTELRENLSAMLPLYDEKEWFMHDVMSLVDVCLGPLLWRLPALKVQLRQTRRTLPMVQYMKRLFATRSFRASLTEGEREMR